MQAEKTPELLQELRRLALHTAFSAATLIKAQRAELVAGEGLAAHTTTKTSAVDPVTVVDQASENFIVAALQEARPQDGLLGEEGAERAGTSGVTWVVDPIDGTVNFLYGIPAYAVSIAAVMNGEPVVGVVVDVEADCAYHAAEGQGAVVECRDGGVQPLQPSAQRELAHALLATGFGYDAGKRALQAALLTKVLPAVRDIRRMGSAALDICRVAAGTVDAYFEHGVKAWDCAAGTIIAREAGVRVIHPGMAAQTAQTRLCMAAPPGIFDQLQQLLEEHGAGTELPA